MHAGSATRWPMTNAQAKEPSKFAKRATRIVVSSKSVRLLNLSNNCALDARTKMPARTWEYVFWKNWKKMKLNSKEIQRKIQYFRTRTLLVQTRSITSAAPITVNKWLDDSTDQSSQFADRTAQKYMIIKFFDNVINFDMCIIEHKNILKLLLFVIFQAENRRFWVTRNISYTVLQY